MQSLFGKELQLQKMTSKELLAKAIFLFQLFFTMLFSHLKNSASLEASEKMKNNIQKYFSN